MRKLRKQSAGWIPLIVVTAMIFSTQATGLAATGSEPLPKSPHSDGAAEDPYVNGMGWSRVDSVNDPKTGALVPVAATDVDVARMVSDGTRTKTEKILDPKTRAVRSTKVTKLTGTAAAKLDMDVTGPAQPPSATSAFIAGPQPLFAGDWGVCGVGCGTASGATTLGVYKARYSSVTGNLLWKLIDYVQWGWGYGITGYRWGWVFNLDSRGDPNVNGNCCTPWDRTPLHWPVVQGSSGVNPVASIWSIDSYYRWAPPNSWHSGYQYSDKWHFQYCALHYGCYWDAYPQINIWVHLNGTAHYSDTYSSG